MTTQDDILTISKDGLVNFAHLYYEHTVIAIKESTKWPQGRVP